MSVHFKCEFQCDAPLIRPSGTFSRWKWREKANHLSLLPLFLREKVPEGRMRDARTTVKNPIPEVKPSPANRQSEN
jgi:hypothetical protein